MRMEGKYTKLESKVENISTSVADLNSRSNSSKADRTIWNEMADITAAGSDRGADQLVVEPPSSHNLQHARHTAQTQQQVNLRLEELERAYTAKLGGEPGQLPSVQRDNHIVHSQPNANSQHVLPNVIPGTALYI